MAEAEVVSGMCVMPSDARKRREKDDSLRGPVKESFDELVRLAKVNIRTSVLITYVSPVTEYAALRLRCIVKHIPFHFKILDRCLRWLPICVRTT